MKKCSLLVSMMLAMVASSVIAGQNSGNANIKGFPFVYSVKFLCGLQMEDFGPNVPPPIEPVVKPGNYATSVNIHNYHWAETTVFKKAVISDGIIGNLIAQTLKPNQATNIDCRQIAKLLSSTTPLPPFIEGYVEIGSYVQLSVTGVYTSRTCFNPTQRCSQLGEVSLEVVPQSFYRNQ